MFAINYDNSDQVERAQADEEVRTRSAEISESRGCGENEGKPGSTPMQDESAAVQELLALTRVQKKVLERHRRYIIAAAEILNGEYPLLREYMNYIRKALME